MEALQIADLTSFFQNQSLSEIKNRRKNNRKVIRIITNFLFMDSGLLYKTPVLSLKSPSGVRQLDLGSNLWSATEKLCDPGQAIYCSLPQFLHL